MALLNELRPQGKSRVWIMLDGRRCACVPRGLIAELGLSVGEYVDEDELGDQLAARQFEGAYQYAVSMLAASAKSSRQLQQKLIQHGACRQAAQAVAERLIEEGLLDDTAYAHRQAELSNQRGAGRGAALNALLRKGIDIETARDSLEDWNSDAEAEAARALAYKQLSSRRNDEPRHARQLALAALARRGFSAETARAALEDARARLEAEADEG